MKGTVSEKVVLEKEWSLTHMEAYKGKHFRKEVVLEKGWFLTHMKYKGKRLRKSDLRKGLVPSWGFLHVEV